MSDDRTQEFMSIATSLGSSPYNNGRNGSGSIVGGGGLSNTTFSSSSSHRSNNNNNNNNTTGGGGGAVAALPKMTPLKTAAYEELRTFHRTASDISFDISHTSKLLSELTGLVRARSLFLDDTATARVNALVLRIKSNITNLNLRLEESAKVIAQQKRRLGDTSQAGQEADNIVGQLREDFCKATTGFKTVLQQRSDWMKEQSERKRDVFGGVGTSTGAAGAGAGGGTEPLSFMDSKPPVYATSNTGTDTGTGMNMLGEGAMPMLDLTSGLLDHNNNNNNDNQLTTNIADNSALPLYNNNNNNNNSLRNRHSTTSSISTTSTSNMLTPLQMQKLDEESGHAGQMMQLIPDQNYLRDRADAMTTVETNIVELGTIFNKLAVMVNEHQEVVQRLEDNVQDADRHIGLSMETLTDALHDLTSNRALFTKLMSVLVVFIIMFITFFA